MKIDANVSISGYVLETGFNMKLQRPPQSLFPLIDFRFLFGWAISYTVFLNLHQHII